MTRASAPQELIDNQQGLVDKLQGQLDVGSKGRKVLPDTEAYLQQAGIDELQLQKQYRDSKNSEIDALLI